MLREKAIVITFDWLFSMQKGAELAAALVDQLMADVDSLSMSSIVPGSLRKSTHIFFKNQ